jgi:D-xylose transport system permease protein
VTTENAPKPDEEAPPSEQTALAEEELKAVAPEVLADSLGDYFRAWWQRIKNGESGALPVLLGLIGIVIFFQAERSVFLSDGNLIDLFEQATIYVMLGAAEIFALLLSEIDLSLGYGAGVGAFIIAELIADPVNLPWWLGIICGLLAMAVLGGFQGALIAWLNLPSFVVTLGGQLGFLGLMEVIANADSSAVGGVITISSDSPVYKLVNDTMSDGLGWAMLAAALLVYAGTALWRRHQRRTKGLTTQALGVTLLAIGAAAIAGVALVWICNANTPSGVPWVIPFVLLVIAFYSWLLARTRIGRYIYAVGANREAARRAGINVKRVLTFGFIMSSVTAGLAGLIYESTTGSMSIDIDGGELVLFAVAAAVIGGASLFGGKGKMVHALIGGVVIATVSNGLAVMGVGTAATYMATAGVLIIAVSLDALVRRRQTVH